jgi:hypothetical protein
MTSQTALLQADQAAQLERLLALREQLGLERRRALSPAVERALEVADVYLFLALGYFGYTERLLPEEE